MRLRAGHVASTVIGSISDYCLSVFCAGETEIGGDEDSANKGMGAALR